MKKSPLARSRRTHSMFSGIVRNVSPVLSVTKDGVVLRVRVARPAKFPLVEGASVAVDGICSTVTKFGKNYFEVEYMPQTLSKTTAKTFARGTLVNLEPSLRYGDPVDGHFVQGHVEGVAKVAAVQTEGKTKKIALALPASLMRYVVALGSLTVNGVSLTVASKTKTTCTVALIPHTLSHTNLGALTRGTLVNVETDIMAALARGEQNEESPEFQKFTVRRRLTVNY